MLEKLRLFLLGLIFFGRGVNVEELGAGKLDLDSKEIYQNIKAQLPDIRFAFSPDLDRGITSRGSWSGAISTYQRYARDLGIRLSQSFEFESGPRIEMHLEFSEGFLTHDINGFKSLVDLMINEVYARLLSPEFRKTHVVKKFIEERPNSISVVDSCQSMIDLAAQRCVSGQDQFNLLLAKTAYLNLLIGLLDCLQIQKEVSAKVGRSMLVGRFDYQNKPGQIFSGIDENELKKVIPVRSRSGTVSHPFLYNSGIISRFFINREVEPELDGTPGQECDNYMIFDETQAGQYVQVVTIFTSKIGQLVSPRMQPLQSKSTQSISPLASPRVSGSWPTFSQPSPTVSTRSQSPLISRSRSKTPSVSPHTSLSPQKRPSISPITSLGASSTSPRLRPPSPLSTSLSRKSSSAGFTAPRTPRSPQRPASPATSRRSTSPALSRASDSSFEDLGAFDEFGITTGDALIDSDPLFAEIRARYSRPRSPVATSPVLPDPRVGLPKMTKAQMKKVEKKWGGRGPNFHSWMKYEEEAERKAKGWGEYLFGGKKEEPVTTPEDPWGPDVK